MRSHTLLPILLILSLSSLLPSSLACPTCPTPPKTLPPPPPRKAKPCPPPPKAKRHPRMPPSPIRNPPSWPKPKPPSPPKAPTTSGCPIDILKLDACVDVLSGLVHAPFGREATRECCPVISGLADLDSALCLCTTVRAKLLNVDILLPTALEVLVDCGKHAPSGFQCPA